MRARTIALPLSLMLFAGAPSMAQDAPTIETVRLNDPGVIGSRVTLQFPGGDQLTGRLLSVEDGNVTIRHNRLGEITVQRADISRTVRPVVIDGLELAPANPEAHAPEPTPAPEPEAEPAVDTQTPDVTWTREFEMGLRGSSGNTERLNFDTSLLLKREDTEGIFTFDTSYYYAEDDGDQTANRFDANVRNEWKLENPRWTIFVQGSYLLDEFQDYDYRVAGGAGVGYKLIEAEDTTLDVRFGVGASREFGDMADEDVHPELILGADFKHNFNDSNRILASTEIFPRLDDAGEFRSISSAAWEIDIDRGNGLAFRVGAEHRYESDVEDAEKSDLDYFARIVYSF